MKYLPFSRPWGPFSLILGILVLLMFPVLFMGSTLLPIYSGGMTPNGQLWATNGEVDPTQIIARDADPFGGAAGDMAYSAFVKNAVLEAGEYPKWVPNLFLGHPFN